MTNLILKNVQIFQAGELSGPRDLNITDGLVSNTPPAQPDQVIDGTGKIVLPGLIDSHVHIRDLEQAYKEDYQTGSQAAAKGGYVYFIDMPTTPPPLLDQKTLMLRKEAAQKSCVPCGFHFGSSAADNTAQIREAVKDPRVHAVKVYMNHTTGDLLIEDEKLLDKIFSVAPFVAAHAEGEKMELALKLAQKHQTRLYICHVSTREELALLRAHKKKRSAEIFTEVTPHHLFLAREDVPDIAQKNSLPPGFFNVRPPLPPRKDQEALWEAVNDGFIDTIGTDHAPHSQEEKRSEQPPFGITGLETALPLLFDAYKRKMIKLKRIVELMSENPARIFSLSGLGSIKINQPANLVLVDPELEKTVKAEELKTKCQTSPFIGRQLTGWPVLTVAAGRVVFQKKRATS